MRQAAETAQGFVQGRIRPDLDSDLMLTFALVRAIEIIGEAANRIAQPSREAHPEIPWSLMIGMRNRLIHGYEDVDPDILWNAVTIDVPALIAALDAWITAS